MAQEASSQSADTTPSPSPAKWLVDQARDYGHGLRNQPTLPDLNIVLTLMKAAARLDPNASEPYQWQTELFENLDRSQDVTTALGEYARRAPDDQNAALRWIGLRVADMQTIEDRRRFIEQQLQQAADRVFIAADAHRRLAEIAFTRADQAGAQKQIDEAMKLTPWDPATIRMAHEMSGADPNDPLPRVRVALRLVAANPMQINLVWQLATLLDDLAMHREAQFWYAYALEVHKAANPGKDPPVEFLFELARSQAGAGEAELAIKTCVDAARINPRYLRARLLMIHLLRKVGRSEAALEQIRTIADNYAKSGEQVLQGRDIRSASEMAWFYAMYAAEPDRAMKFAQVATSAPSPSPDALRSLGFAHLLTKNLEEAERVLKPLSSTDQMAAVGLAKVYIAAKKPTQAIPVLLTAARLRPSGIAYDEIARLLRENGASLPPPSDRSEVRKLLADFDRAPLEYYRQPAKSLRLALSFTQTRIAPGDPWFVRFELTNTGTFPITFGDEMMVSPTLLLSLAASGDRDRQFPHYMLVHLDRLPALQPGKSIRMIQSVDIGPVRRALGQTVHVSQEIALGGLLDPVQSPEGQWTHRLGGLVAVPVKATRLAVGATPQYVAELQSALTSQKSDEVLRSATLLTALLAEQDALRDGSLAYKDKVSPIDETAVFRALFEAIARQDKEPAARAQIIESFRRIRWRDTLTKPLAPYLSDSHWLVRLMTAWLFAHKQGPGFATVARHLSTTDPEPLVRDLLAAYKEKWDQRPVAPK